jgi:RNA polymerase sigma factor (sigma-70 family)
MDDAKLLALTAAGDKDAFAAFYRRHLPAVVSFALRATGDREIAADLAGEVFAAALQSCERYEARHESAAPWLYGIAHNKLRESMRRGRVEDATRRRLGIRPLELEDDDLRQVEELAALAHTGVVGVLDSLPRDEQAAVRARVLDEREYREIASELDCSESVVRQRVSRGLARARNLLSNPDELRDAS